MLSFHRLQFDYTIFFLSLLSVDIHEDCSTKPKITNGASDHLTNGDLGLVGYTVTCNQGFYAGPQHNKTQYLICREKHLDWSNFYPCIGWFKLLIN